MGSVIFKIIAQIYQRQEIPNQGLNTVIFATFRDPAFGMVEQLAERAIFSLAACAGEVVWEDKIQCNQRKKRCGPVPPTGVQGNDFLIEFRRNCKVNFAVPIPDAPIETS